MHSKILLARLRQILLHQTTFVNKLFFIHRDFVHVSPARELPPSAKKGDILHENSNTQGKCTNQLHATTNRQNRYVQTDNESSGQAQENYQGDGFGGRFHFPDSDGGNANNETAQRGLLSCMPSLQNHDRKGIYELLRSMRSKIRLEKVEGCGHCTSGA